MNNIERKLLLSKDKGYYLGSKGQWKYILLFAFLIFLKLILNAIREKRGVFHQMSWISTDNKKKSTIKSI